MIPLYKVLRRSGAFFAVTAVILAVACAAEGPTALPEQPTPALEVRQLELIAEPSEAADFLLNPKPVGTGDYVSGIAVTIDVLPKEGWEIKEWAGPVYETAGNTAKITMDSTQTVVVRLVRASLQVTPPATALPGSVIVPTRRPAPSVGATPVALPTQPQLNGAAVFRGHSYLIVTDRMNWAEAKRYAESLGGHLVTINDEAEQRFVADLAKAQRFDRIFIGLTDEAEEGRFVWVTSEPVTYTNWGDGEPNNSNDGFPEHYVLMNVGRNGQSLWNDVSRFGRPFLVEFEGLTSTGTPPKPTAVPRAAPTATPRPVPTPTAAPKVKPTTVPAPTRAPLPTHVPKPTLVFAGLDWTSVQVQNGVARYIVENGYGYPTEQIHGSTVPLFQRLINREIDISMEIWLPNQEEIWSEAIKRGQVVSAGKSLEDNWQSTFVVPTYMVEQNPGLGSVYDLARFKALWADPASGGRAVLTGCLAGWQCSRVNREQIAAYGLEDVVELRDPGTQAGLFGSLETAYLKREPWLGYMWGPSVISNDLDLTLLEEPSAEGCADPGAGCAFPPAQVMIAVNPELPTDAPEIMEFLKNWDWNGVNQLFAESWYEDNKQYFLDPFEATGIYFLKNSGAWRAWVPDHVEAKVNAALAAEASP